MKVFVEDRKGFSVEAEKGGVLIMVFSVDGRVEVVVRGEMSVCSVCESTSIAAVSFTTLEGGGVVDEASSDIVEGYIKSGEDYI